MRGRVELSRTHVALERGLAIAGAVAVAWVLVNQPSSIPGKFTTFAVTMVVAAWLPLLARRRWRAVGTLEVTRDWLAVGPGAQRRIPLREIEGVRAVAGTRGGSVLMALVRGGLLAVDLDDAADAAQLASRLRQVGRVEPEIVVRHSRWPWLVWTLRLITTLFAALYYLHVVANVVPGDKAFYGLGALFAGVVLFLVHQLRHGAPGPLFEQAQPASTDHSASLLRHLRGHFVHDALVGTVERRPLLDEHDAPARWLTEMRSLLAEQDSYRSGSSGHRERLEAAVASPATPLAQRALALRVLADEGSVPVVQRIAAFPDDLAAEAEWLEEVATIEDDGRALKLLERRVPMFRPGDGGLRQPPVPPSPPVPPEPPKPPGPTP